MSRCVSIDQAAKSGYVSHGLGRIDSCQRTPRQRRKFLARARAADHHIVRGDTRLEIWDENVISRLGDASVARGSADSNHLHPRAAGAASDSQTVADGVPASLSNPFREGVADDHDPLPTFVVVIAKVSSFEKRRAD